MVRKCASFAFCVAVMLALGFALAHANTQKVPGASIDFSTPWEPASPSFKAAGELKAATIESTFPVENTEATAGVVRISLIETVARAIPPPAPRAFPPLWHRPPPANS
jgi:hypothetical protein